MATRARELIRNGNRSILEDITMGNLQLVTGKLVCDTAAGGDPVASMVIHEAVEYLGIALANVINVINPDTIVLGGPVGRNSGDLFLGPLKEVLRKRTMSHPLTAVRISKSTMGDDAGARGAAALVLAEKVDLIFAREEFATLI
ncbi:MAG: ROK family protein [Firmicutes bacterium]|nr:ROK family protein [Bacillota bacterium]